MDPSPRAAPAPPRPWLLALTFVLVRLAWLTADPGSLHNIEERFTGTVAHELSGVPAFPLFAYHYESYGGGPLVLGLVGAPLFELLGPRFLTLKLLALLWSLASFLVWMGLLRRSLGETGRFAAAVVWIAAPPAWQRLSLMAWGNHMESSLFTGAMLWLFVSGHGLAGTGRALRLALAGLVAGFSVYFCLTSLAGIAALLALWAVLERGFPRRGLLAFSGGAVLGLLPWLAYNLPRGFPGLAIQGRGLAGHLSLLGTPLGAARKLLGLVAVDLPRALAPWPVPGAPRIAGALLLCALVLAGVLAACRLGALRDRALPRAAAAFGPLYLAVYAVAYGLSDFGAWPESTGVYAHRYLAPLLPVLALCVGALVQSLAESAAPRSRRLARLLPVLPALLAIPPLERAVRVTDRPARWLAYSGTSYHWLGITLGQRPGEAEDLLGRVDRIFDARDREGCLRGLAVGALRARLEPLVAARGALGFEDLASTRDWIAGLGGAGESRAVPHLLEALAGEIRYRAERGQLGALDPERWLAGLDRGLAGVTPHVRLAHVRALAVALAAASPSGPARALDWLAALPPGERRAALEALGEWAGPPALTGAPTARGGPGLAAALAALDEGAAASFAAGQGRAAARHLARDPALVTPLLERFAPALRPSLLCGVLASIERMDEDPAVAADLRDPLLGLLGAPPRCAAEGAAAAAPSLVPAPRPEQPPGPRRAQGSSR